MSLERDVSTQLDDNGRPKIHYRYTADHPGHVDDDGCGVLLTGPVQGTVTLKDGTSYDVTPELIEHLPGHAGPICHHIERMLEATGQLGQLRPDGAHTCTEVCGQEAD